MLFFVIFIIIPLMEISVFISVGDEIGVIQTLLLCFLTAAIGGYLVKMQGLDTLFRGRQVMNQGYLPVQELFDGFCIVVAGAMLITPGFVTDFIGFSLLVPPVRRMVQAYLSKRMDIYMETSASRKPQPPQSGVIEGEFERVEDEKDKP